MRALKPDPTKDPTLLLENQLLLEHSVASVIGLDEAGRGAIAGPVAVGAHVYKKSDTAFPVGLRDSKLLSEKRREMMLPQVEAWGSGSVGFATANEIDEHGITLMLAQAARRALITLHDEGIDVSSSIILLDGSHDWLTPALKSPLHVITRVAADRAHASVAAASMRAKVNRDKILQEAAQNNPVYGWASNKGYGSASHYAAIAEFGLSEMHRKTWVK